MSARLRSSAAQHGVSLIEALCVLSIASVVIGSAVPGLDSARQKAQLQAVAAQVGTDVQFAKSQASALNRTVTLTLREADGATCYIVHTGPAANCACSVRAADTATCGGTSELLRAVGFAPSDPAQVRSATRSLTFDPVRGTVTPTATLRIEARDGRAVHQVVNLLGRVRTCTPQGRVAGERSC